MNEPPVLLDGARVLEFAILGDSARGIADGVALGPDAVARLAIAESLLEEGVFLLHCDAEWGTVIGESFADLQAARVAAAEAYRGHAIGWSAFRPLTPEESREVETTRAFLRELTADYPPG
ncbi:MAG TPA: hypothetical protein VLY46_07290 [Usitatibacter sp.]|nr:hypothetical protein [Usitatibacter sp.]